MPHKPGRPPSAPPTKRTTGANRRKATPGGAKQSGRPAPPTQASASADVSHKRVPASTESFDKTAPEDLLDIRPLRSPDGKNFRVPLPQVGIHQPSSTLPLISISAINDRGRLAAARTLTFLKWRPRQPITFTVDDQLLVVTVTDAPPKLRIDSHQHLYIPAELRNRLHLKSGDRILLVASEEHRKLVIYPPHALVTALFSQDPSVWLRL